MFFNFLVFVLGNYQNRFGAGFVKSRHRALFFLLCVFIWFLSFTGRLLDNLCLDGIPILQVKCSKFADVCQIRYSDLLWAVTSIHFSKYYYKIMEIIDCFLIWRSKFSRRVQTKYDGNNPWIYPKRISIERSFFYITTNLLFKADKTVQKMHVWEQSILRPKTKDLFISDFFLLVVSSEIVKFFVFDCRARILENETIKFQDVFRLHLDESFSKCSSNSDVV